MKALVVALALVALPSAEAQSSGCTRQAPCPWTLDVDAHGFTSPVPLNWTAGDWIRLESYNDHDLDHILRSASLGVDLTVPAVGIAHVTFVADVVGNHTVVDYPTQQTVGFQVLAPPGASEPPSSGMDRQASGGSSAPGLGAALLVPACALLALAARRPQA